MNSKPEPPPIEATFLRRLLSQARNRARRANIEFTLSDDYAERQFAAQEGRCDVSGVEFHLERFPDGNGISSSILPTSPCRREFPSVGAGAAYDRLGPGYHHVDVAARRTGSKRAARASINGRAGLPLIARCRSTDTPARSIPIARGCHGQSESY
jgi:hypothetical protein